MQKGLWRNWRLRTQICLIQSVLTSFIIILVMISTYAFLQYATEAHVKTSEKIFQKQFGKQAKIIMFNHIQSVQYTLFRNRQQILKTNALYQLMQSIQSPIIEQPYSCLNNLSLIDDYAYSVSFCYEIYAQTEPTVKLQYLKNLCSFLTRTFLMIDGDYDLLFASTGNIHFFSVWPGSYLGPIYNPQKRLWYTNHLEQSQKYPNNETIFSPPYVHYTWKLLMISQTANLESLDGYVDGVIASHVNLTQFKQSNKDISFSIFYPDGRLLLSQYNITENSFIYDTNLTNLSYNDYQQIINQVNGNPTNSTCDSDVWDNFDFLCLKLNNSHNHQELFNAHTIEHAGLILLIQIKLSQFHIQLQNMFQEFQYIIQNMFVGTFLGFFGYMITSVIVSSFVIIILFNPLIRIINYTSHEIFRENLSKQYTLKKKTELKFIRKSLELTTIENLQQSFNNMIHSISNKSELCFLLENFIYPKKRWRMKKRTKKINKNNLKLKNNNNEINDKLDYDQIKFIQSLFRQHISE